MPGPETGSSRRCGSTGGIENATLCSTRGVADGDSSTNGSGMFRARTARRAPALVAGQPDRLLRAHEVLRLLGELQRPAGCFAGRCRRPGRCAATSGRASGDRSRPASSGAYRGSGSPPGPARASSRHRFLAAEDLGVGGGAAARAAAGHAVGAVARVQAAGAHLPPDRRVHCGRRLPSTGGGRLPVRGRRPPAPAVAGRRGEPAPPPPRCRSRPPPIADGSPCRSSWNVHSRAVGGLGSVLGVHAVGEPRPLAVSRPRQPPAPPRGRRGGSPVAGSSAYPPQHQAAATSLRSRGVGEQRHRRERHRAGVLQPYLVLHVGAAPAPPARGSRCRVTSGICGSPPLFTASA